MDKEIKEVKSYSLPPSQIAWLRQQALNESTPKKTVSASAVLERIIDQAMKQAQSPTQKKTNRAVDARQAVIAA